jgi:RIO-like serine/threonine protein kinase
VVRVRLVDEQELARARRNSDAVVSAVLDHVRVAVQVGVVDVETWSRT